MNSVFSGTLQTERLNKHGGTEELKRGQFAIQSITVRDNHLRTLTLRFCGMRLCLPYGMILIITVTKYDHHTALINLLASINKQVVIKSIA